MPESSQAPPEGSGQRGESPGVLRRMLNSTEPRVFFPAGAIVLAFVILAVASPTTTVDGEQVKVVQQWVSQLQAWVVAGAGWYYVVIIAAFIVFALWVGFGHFGDIKLGKDDEEPEFKLMPWFAMLFAAGMGIGLMFYGLAEPMWHVASPKPGTGDQPAVDLAEDGLVQSYLHWGLHPWAIYVVVGLAVAYAVHRKGKPVSIRWALEPVLGDRVRGWLGHAIDIAAIVGTLFGVATSLGLGALQIAAGLNANLPGLGMETAEGAAGLPHVLIIIVITAAATVSVVTGVDKGIKWLSNINMGMAGLLLLFVALFGPTFFLLRTWIESLGAYLQNFLALSFDVTAWQVAEGLAWQGGWTLYYWGWWISWAPFVGVFIARISKGRTIREFVTGVLFVPSIVGFLWFAVFGGTGLHSQIFGEGGLLASGEIGNGTVDDYGVLFTMLHQLPLGTITGFVAIFLIAVFFITSSDSGSFVVDMLASGGSHQPPRWSRVFWALLEGAVAIALLLLGGLSALQGVAILVALPFSVVMLVMMAASWKQFQQERQVVLRVQRRQQREEIAQHLVEEGYVEEPENGDSGASATTTVGGGAKT